MTNEQLKDKILSIAPEAELTEEESQFLNIIVPATQLYVLAKKLKEDAPLSFDYLFCLTAIDLPEHFMVVYHLTSTKNEHTIVLKAKITDKEKPAVDTVCNIWRTAEFHEREVYDMFGIKFNNHPDLRRLLMDDDWVGYPLRKDYVDEVNIVKL